MKEVISVHNVSKKYGKKNILKEVNFSVNQGEIFGILGGSGSGKSVLIKMLIGFLKPDRGKVKVNGSLGFSMQNNSFYNSLTIKQNLNYFSRLYEIKNKDETINYLIDVFHLKEHKNKLVSKLSGGQKKRLDIACALLNHPEILILDEPFAGLDTKLVRDLSKILKILKEHGITIILSSHLLNQIEKICTNIVFIQDQKLYSVEKSQLKDLY